MSLPKRKRVSDPNVINMPADYDRVVAALSNPEAEAAVLGAVLRDPSVYASVSEILQPADFMSLWNGYVWYAFDRITERGAAIDLVTVADELDAQKQLQANSMDTLAEYVTNAPRAHSAETYAQIISDNALRLRIVREADYFTQEQADYMAKREEAMAKELEADQRKQDALAEQERQRIEKQKAFQQQAARDVINFTTQTISLTTDMLQQSGKDQTFVMKALLAAQKLLAIPSIIVAGQLAEANAAAFASMTGGMMSAETARQMMRIQTMISVGLVAGTAIAGMAHSGIEEVPREGT